ncbi:MAG: hypothetical protein M0P99_05120 [Candidatus Cloacimonetes bacterium]|nr:hypothetical protein [Candidatus Cloacimonadota bacterium]
MKWLPISELAVAAELLEKHPLDAVANRSLPPQNLTKHFVVNHIQDKEKSHEKNDFNYLRLLYVSCPGGSVL